MAKHWRQTSHARAPLEAFVKFAHQIQNTTDALVISGDLATSGDRPDLTAAYQLYTAPPANPNVCLTANGEPTLARWVTDQKLDVLPGNHDRFGPARNLYRPGSKVFDKVFCPPGGTQLWSRGQGVDHGFAIRRGSWVVHLEKADFTLRSGDGGKRFRGLPGWFGQGRVEQRVLAQLVAATLQTHNVIAKKKCNPVTLWAIHFDPSTTDELHELLDTEELAQAAKTLGVMAILCGHTHETKVKPLSDTTLVYACGTVAQARAPHWDCQTIEITTDDVGAMPPKISAQWYRYAKKKGFSLLPSP